MTSTNQGGNQAEPRTAHRPLIIVRSALIGFASVLPIPVLDDKLVGALRRGLVQHIAGLSHVDIDDDAVGVLLTEPAENKRLSTFAILGTLLSLLRPKGRMRRMFTALMILRGLDEALQMFHLATLLDHYCAYHHVGAAIDVARAKRLRQAVAEAWTETRRELTAEAMAGLGHIATRLLRAASDGMSSLLSHRPRLSDLPKLPSLSAVASRTQALVRDVAERRYLGRLVEKFDCIWHSQETAATTAEQPKTTN